MKSPVAFSTLSAEVAAGGDVARADLVHLRAGLVGAPGDARVIGRMADMAELEEAGASPPARRRRAGPFRGRRRAAAGKRCDAGRRGESASNSSRVRAAPADRCRPPSASPAFPARAAYEAPRTGRAWRRNKRSRPRAMSGFPGAERWDRAALRANFRRAATHSRRSRSRPCAWISRGLLGAGGGEAGMAGSGRTSAHVFATRAKSRQGLRRRSGRAR